MTDLRQAQHRLRVDPPNRGLVDITAEVAAWLVGTGIQTGLLNLFVHHTSCSLLIQENADVTVQHDLERFFARLVPDGDAMFHHRSEGPDDMPAHVRSALTQTSLTVPVADGRLALGTWQGIYLYEHRLRPPPRSVHLHLLGQ